ncbi:MAG: UDP-N-acetylglucosamine 2-epimerase (hydrolyzing) [Nitrospirae bacterium]|nr:UDP-N-acetylglucosamine 2-epimerase (hydrolyzing) [Magnetococcales bacterium]HAT50881.1 UDP-N-acetylglucosamine 2-epimerase (hydrolyzing) [Alphaproteobacteria bacterium]
MVRTIAIITGSRAEYGLLQPLMTAVREDPRTDLALIVTGMHLDPRFGATVTTIAADGFEIAAQVAIPLAGDSPMAVARAMGVGLPGIAEVLERIKPAILVILGDRYEMLCAAQAALLTNIPIAHIHGGESSEGAMDEAIRHAISKLSHLHFTAAEPYRNRVIQMGEDPARVWNVGALGLETIRTLQPMSRQALEESLQFALGEHYFLITIHPETLSQDLFLHQVAELLDAFAAFPDHKLLFTGVNADPGHAAIDQMITCFCDNYPQRTLQVQSLGQLRYLSAMHYCSAVVGNSSSGILEAPAMKVPTVNVGRRQQGRLRAKSVLDCDGAGASIVKTLEKALSPDFKAMVQRASHPFGDGHCVEKIMDVLTTQHLDNLLVKRFYDL